MIYFNISLVLVVPVLLKNMLEIVGHIWGFIMVIAVGLVDSNWILTMETGHSVVSFQIIGGTVYCCFVC